MKKRLISESFYLLVTYIALQWREYVQCGLWRSSHGNIPQSPCSSCTHEQVHKGQPWDQRTISSDHTPGITIRQGKEVCWRWRNGMSDVTERERTLTWWSLSHSHTHTQNDEISMFIVTFTRPHTCVHTLTAAVIVYISKPLWGPVHTVGSVVTCEHICKGEDRVF